MVRVNVRPGLSISVLSWSPLWNCAADTCRSSLKGVTAVAEWKGPLCASADAWTGALAGATCRVGGGVAMMALCPGVPAAPLADISGRVVPAWASCTPVDISEGSSAASHTGHT